jgi:Uma2 family endonuclease
MPPSFACLGPERKDRIFDCDGECDIQSNMNAMLPLAELKPHKLTVDDLFALERGGAFAETSRMELLNGVLYEMSPQTSPHVRARNRLTFRLQVRILELGILGEAFSEATIIIDDHSAPEPDIIICDKPETEGYFAAASVMLAVEVAVSTLQTDMKFKNALYASARISEYWVVDVEAKRIHQFWESDGTDYQKSCIVNLGNEIACKTIPGLQIETDRLI